MNKRESPYRRTTAARTLPLPVTTKPQRDLRPAVGPALDPQAGQALHDQHAEAQPRVARALPQADSLVAHVDDEVRLIELRLHLHRPAAARIGVADGVSDRLADGQGDRVGNV